jgi:hypothetical protein
MKKFSKPQIFAEWKNFLERCMMAELDILKITDITSKGFIDHYQKVKIKHLSSNDNVKRTFLIPNHYAYFSFDFVDGEKRKEVHSLTYLERPEPSINKSFEIEFKFVMGHLDNQTKPYNVKVVDFLYHYCNPDFIGILEKISWEING